MNEIKNILINNWQLIVAAIIFILSFILQLLKKRPISPIYDLIYNFAISAINDAEVCSKLNPGFKGQDKLNRAVDFVKRCLKSVYPTLDLNAYTNIIIDIIEKILSCPEKKGGK